MAPRALQKAHTLQPGAQENLRVSLAVLLKLSVRLGCGGITYNHEYQTESPTLVLSPRAPHGKPTHPSDVGCFDSSRTPSTSGQARSLWDRQTYRFGASFGCTPTLAVLLTDLYLSPAYLAQC